MAHRKTTCPTSSGRDPLSISRSSALRPSRFSDLRVDLLGAFLDRLTGLFDALAYRLAGLLKAFADLVIEVVLERMDVKQDLFRRLDGIVKQGK